MGKRHVFLAALVGVAATLVVACAGADGPQGASGAAGPQGVAGDQGPAGAKGDAGPAGAQGPAGPKGDAGPAGVQGPAGAKGDAGSAGAQGPAGPKGDAGPAGVQGPRGNDGEDGLDWPGLVPASYESADGVLGGAAYSKWWTTDAGGSGTQPETAVGADFYRCKSCHAWDGLGNAGSYADRTGQSTGKTSRPDVTSVNLRASALRETPAELYDLIARPSGRTLDAADNSHPGYSQFLTEDQIWDLVKFMKEEWVEPTDLYELKVEGPAMYWDYSTDPATLQTPTRSYSSIGAGGDAGRGATLVANTCSACHGTDGTGLDIGGASLGQTIREKPHEAWFKVKFGEAGTGMAPGLLTATQDLKDLFAALADADKFPNAAE